MNSVIEKDDNVMVFQPKLAQLLGLNETIIINQIHYWLKKSKNIIEGRYWVYNTYENWQEQICFLSVSTIKKGIKKLELMGIIKSGNFNKSKIDKTKWYTLDYEVLQAFYDEAEKVKVEGISENKISLSKDEIGQRTDINEPSIVLTEHKEEVETNQPIPEITTETTTSHNKENSGQEDNSDLLGDFVGVVNFYKKNVRLPGSYELEKIMYLCEEFKDSELIIFAIKQSIESNARNLRYVEKVLYSWLDKGIKTAEAAEKFIEDYKKHKEGKENGKSTGIYGKNKCYNSKTSSKDNGKWTGYKPPKPRGNGSVNAEGLL